MHRTHAAANAARLFVLLAAAGFVAACGTRQPAATVEVPPPVEATAQNSLVMPPVTYGTTSQGLRLSKSDDNCDVPALLRQAVEDQIEEPLLHLLFTQPPRAVAPLLKVEVSDLLANAGGLYGGPKIVELRGTLERPGAVPVHFTAKRQMFLYFGLPRSTCSMVGKVTYALGGDIVGWLRQPVDGAFLGER